MTLPVTRLRRWFAAAVIVMVVTVAGMYFYARWRVSGVVREIPAKVGLDIQQTAEGFSISKSEQGRTLFTISASKAVQFKQGGRAELHNVKIVVYGKDSTRFDRIVGDDFEYDPKSGDVTAKGKVLIDLEANPEGMKNSDQAPPTATRNPIHVETEGLVFNKNTGDASASGKVLFATPEASGSAQGVQYVSKTGAMILRSDIEMAVTRPQQFRLIADRGLITKEPREIELSGVRLSRPQQKLASERVSFFLRDDDTVARIEAEGRVEGEFQGKSDARIHSDRAELLLTGTQNQLTTATLTGNVHLASEGAQAANADAGRVTLHFGAGQVLKTVRAEDGVRLAQKKEDSPATAQDVEMTAPTMDFVVKDGHLLELAQTTGPPEIVISQLASKQRTSITAARFTAKFTDKNRLAGLHGEPDAKIVSSAPGQPDRTSTSPILDVFFQPQGGISSITQSGGLTYTSGPQKAFAQRGDYTAADQMLGLSGSPRVVDGSMTTTADSIRLNRVTGDAVAEGNVKSTYSDLKPQPSGGMLAASDPIHVTSRTMTAHRSPAIAVYSGNARLWQNSNVVEAPTLQFDREHRALVAESTAAQPVKTVLVQVDQSGKVTPATITSTRLAYNDADRKILLTGGVTVKGNDATMTARKMTVLLATRPSGVASNGSGQLTGPAGNTGQIEKIVAEESVLINQATRRATGDRLIYTVAEDKFELTGGPPSIFDAERGKITGDSLTFYRHDDRVLVEGRETSPAVTKTQVAR
jgi:lipopolysaccharide export system protein LptA